MQAEDEDPMFIGRTVSIAIAAVVPNAQLMSQRSFLRIECSHPQIGERVCIWLTLGAEQSGPAHGWVLGINVGDGAATPVFTDLESAASQDISAHIARNRSRNSLRKRMTLRRLVFKSYSSIPVHRMNWKNMPMSL
jgi:hypothetical protein